MIQLTTQQPSAPLRHPWREGIAMGRAFELLRADGQSHLRQVQKAMGYRYCRFHGLFHDEMGTVSRLPEGGLAYQWSQTDKLLDFLLEIGLTPFLELGPMPKALASGSTLFFQWKMNVTPPKSWEEWGGLVTALAEHCIERYGIQEVRKWQFEVWNEPNLPAFWTGTQEEYWKLYQTSAAALKGVDSELQVGGPASAEAGWIEPFLDMCHAENVPVDFLSTHAYPQNEFADYASREDSPHAAGEYFADIVRRVKGVVEQKRPGLPVYWTEWSSLDAKDREDVDWYANETIDQLEAAACAVRNCVALDGDTQGLFWWVASDIFEEMGLPHAPFSNSFGLVSVDGLPKASYHAFRMLGQLRGPVLQSSIGGQGYIATQEGKCIRVMLWNHIPWGMEQTVYADKIALPGATGGILSSLHLKRGQGSAYEAWRDAGESHNSTSLQHAALKAMSTPLGSYSRLDSDVIPFHLEPGEVLLMEITPGPDPKVEKGTNPATGLWEAEDVADALHVEDRDR